MNKIKTLIVVLLLSLNPVFSQVVDLGNLSDYIFFTSEGDITNTGTDTITGNVGSNFGSISLAGTTHTGIVHNQDSITAQAKLDLINLYQQLTCARNTDSTRVSAFGFDETLTPGVYKILTAGSLEDTITLDGQGDTNALFIIKFAGAFTVAANSTIILTDSARACNVFWITAGNCIIDTAATLMGTFISSDGAITMSKHGELTGRLLTMVGDIDFGPFNAQIPTKSTTAFAKCRGFYHVVNLGSLANFVFFTSNGGIANTGPSTIKGDIGSDFGIIGLPGAIHTGNVHNLDAITAQASIDLVALYQQLMCFPITDTSHTATFGGGETLTPGVYSIGAAGSLGAGITFDAQGDTNALFIMKFGAAFTVGAASAVYLAGGARACNVFWITEAAASIGEATTMVGTVISSAGAIAMDASGNLTGRLLTMDGAIAFGPSNGQIPNYISKEFACVAPVGANPNCSYIKINSVSLYNMYTSLGAIENEASSNITGKVGTNSGEITGFETSTVDVDAFHIADSLTAVTKNDLSALYSQLFVLQATNTGHAAAFGGGDTLLPGIYLTSAGSVYENLILNGLGDSNSLFIFQFTGDFSAAAASSISLINGIRDCNVYWVAKGEITIAGTSSMIGSFISKNGSIAMGEGASLKGRILTGDGAISINNIESIALPECGCYQYYPLPIDLLSFSGECLSNQIRLNWETATETNNDYFSIERSMDGINWSEVGKINGAGNSSSSRKYFLDDENQYNDVSYYRLKQHDFSGISRTFSPISVQKCLNSNEAALSIYPNPARNAININFNGDVAQIANSTIVDLSGRNMYQSSIYQSSINTDNYQDGLYFLQLNLNSGNITRTFLIAK
jgi:hypothetical protein